MSFDAIAPHYHWMEHLFAGGLMQRCRTTHLDRVTHCRRALLVGEGTGRFLTELLRRNAEVRVTCVEQSAGMIQQMRRRLRRAGVDGSHVEFQQTDALARSTQGKKYDLIATHFFLDCFEAAQLEQLIAEIAVEADEGAMWLISDFRVPENSWRRWRAQALLTGLYTFFHYATDLPAKKLTPPDDFLTKANFKLVERCIEDWGFAHADLWQRVTNPDSMRQSQCHGVIPVTEA